MKGIIAVVLGFLLFPDLVHSVPSARAVPGDLIEVDCTFYRADDTVARQLEGGCRYRTLWTLGAGRQ